MKTIKGNRYKSLLCFLTLTFFFTACDRNGNIDVPQDKLLKVTTSSDYIELNENLIDEVALTLTWTAAREHGEDYTISYLTKLDLSENDFSDPIRTELEEEIFSVSYTHGELQRLLTSKWYQGVNKEVSMTFRVIGIVDGPKYVLPEVDDITVRIKTYGPQVIEASGISMNGTSVPGGARLSRALENEYVFAYYGQLDAGTINFPINVDGATVISPASENTTLPITDATPMEVRVKEAEKANYWEIPSAGKYRIVVDLEQKTVSIYSETNDIPVMKVIHTSNDTEAKAITAMYAYGEPTGWGWSDENALIQSIANPNVWIFNAKALSGRTKFGVTKANTSFTFSCEPTNAETGKDSDIELNKPMKITGGANKGQRDSYFKISSGVNFIVLDLDRMTVTFSVK